MSLKAENKPSYTHLVGLLEELKNAYLAAEPNTHSQETQELRKIIIDTLGDTQDLSFINFPGLTFKGSKNNMFFLPNLNLSHGSVTGSYFLNVELYDGNFQYADLRNSQFIHCDFTNADFSYANLQNTIFNPCALYKTNLQYADLRNAQFISSGASQADFQHSDLRGAVFQSTMLRFYDYTHADLSYTNLQGVEFLATEIDDVKINHANLKDAIIGTKVRGNDTLNLHKDSFANADVEGCVFIVSEDPKNNATYHPLIEKGAIMKLSNSLKHHIHKNYETELFGNSPEDDDTIAERLVHEYKLHKTTIPQIKLALHGEDIDLQAPDR